MVVYGVTRDPYAVNAVQPYGGYGLPNHLAHGYAPVSRDPYAGNPVKYYGGYGLPDPLAHGYSPVSRDPYTSHSVQPYGGYGLPNPLVHGYVPVLRDPYGDNPDQPYGGYDLSPPRYGYDPILRYAYAGYPVQPYGGYDPFLHGYGYDPVSRYPYADYLFPYGYPGVRLPYQGCSGKRHALIWLHGLGGNFGLPVETLFRVRGRIADSVEIVVPKAPKVTNPLLGPFQGPEGVSWFSFNLMPAISVISPIPGENPEELEAAFQQIESIVDDLVAQCIPSENIVVSGASQGGVLTLYHALHSRHKMGGYIPLVTWMPNLVADPPTDYDPINRDTPIFQLNGGLDLIVPHIPAGMRTRDAMSQIFSNYNYEIVPMGAHGSTMPLSLNKQIRFLKDNNLLEFKSILGGFGDLGGLGNVG